MVRAKKHDYLIAFACFSCRKSFKMGLHAKPQTCPNCGDPLKLMGRSFKTPKNTDYDEWKKVEKLWTAGYRFWSYRRAPDAEPIPKRLSEVDSFIARNPNHPLRTGHLDKLSQ